MDISIIICTYNRSKKLIDTINSIAESVKNLNNKENVEIVIVDNNSTDDTHKIIKYFNDNNNLKFRYVMESKRGLSHARNKGLKEANGEIIIFTDDDVIVDKNWVGEIKKEMDSDKNIMLLCGRTFMYNKDNIPLSTKTSPDRQIFLYPVNPWDVGNGNNMVIKKEVIKNIGEFDVSMGAGSKIGSGEDTDYMYRILKNKYKGVYSPNSIAYHNHDRIEENDVEKIRFNYAKGMGAFYAKHIVRGDIWVAKISYWQIKNMIKIILNNPSRRKLIKKKFKGIVYGFLYRFFLDTKNYLKLI